MPREAPGNLPGWITEPLLTGEDPGGAAGQLRSTAQDLQRQMRGRMPGDTVALCMFSANETNEGQGVLVDQPQLSGESHPPLW